MASWDDPDCYFPIQMTNVDEILELLHPDRLLEHGCRVIKRPGCCALCAANEDCRRIPMHVRCHCVPELYFMIDFVN